MQVSLLRLLSSLSPPLFPGIFLSSFVFFLAFSSVCRIMVFPVAARSPLAMKLALHATSSGNRSGAGKSYYQGVAPPCLPGIRRHRLATRLFYFLFFACSHLFYLFYLLRSHLFVVRIKGWPFPPVFFQSSLKLFPCQSLYFVYKKRSSSYLPRHSQLRCANPTLLLP